MLAQRATAFASNITFRGSLRSSANFVGRGGAEPGEGKYCELTLFVEKGIIRKVRFETNGCPSSVAAGSALCTLIEGRELERCKELTPRELLLFIGGLPEGTEDAADRAIAALKTAKEVEVNG